MNSGSSAELRRQADQVPWDLRRWFDDRTIVRLALDAVQSLERGIPPVPGQDLSPRMMLTLLSYCYAVGVYGSEDIVWATRHDAAARYICAHNPPDMEAVRAFRRAARSKIAACLVRMMQQAWALKLDAAEVDYGGYGWFESDLNREIRDRADVKLEVAALMDRIGLEV
ncbi:MAG TPA: transposase [Methylomirabilota bacterium]|nr:transposase [Methylomirabilota bacterium]